MDNFVKPLVPTGVGEIEGITIDLTRFAANLPFGDFVRFV